jgi:dTDP-4-amino-4,6-dideoxygalactose transaminase
MIATSDKNLFGILRALRNHGGVDKYDIFHIGYNARLDTIQAQVLLLKLKYIKKYISLRRKTARAYNAGFRGFEKYIAVPSYEANHTFNQYTIRVFNGRRDKLREYLRSNGIDSQVYYPVPLHRMDIFRRYSKIHRCPATDKLKDEVLSLPVHPFLKEEEVEYTIRCIKKFFK